MDKQSVIKKIKKCLALSESANAHEAAIALSQAQKLMAEYALDMADIAMADVEEKKARATVKSKPARWETVLADAVAKALQCELLFSTTWRMNGRSDWTFIGISPAPELASYAFAALLRQLRRDRTDYAQKRLGRCKAKTRKARLDEFNTGWVNGVYTKVLAQWRTGHNPGRTAIKAYLDKHHANLGTLTNRNAPKPTATSQRHDDFGDGYDKGSQAELNRAVAGKQAPLSLGNTGG